MRLIRITGVCLVFTAGALAQQASSPSVPGDRTHLSTTKVYYGSPEVALPEMLAPQQPTPELNPCKDEQEGTVEFSLIVDAQGNARNIAFERKIGNDLDPLALEIAESDRFKPATLQGNPVAVGRKLKMHLLACTVKGKDSSGKKVATLRLQSQPKQYFEDSSRPAEEIVLNSVSSMPAEEDRVYPVGNGVEAPKVVFSKEAEFSDYARKKNIQGTCIVSVLVDEHGLPQNVHIARKLEDSLDQKAMDAVKAYRFKPAMKNGHPVAVRVSIEVQFRLYMHFD